jgi:hypothetical protein
MRVFVDGLAVVMRFLHAERERHPLLYMEPLMTTVDFIIASVPVDTKPIAYLGRRQACGMLA